MGKRKQYEVWIKNGLRMQQWAYLGGVAGPMPKYAAERYVKEFAQNGIHAEARIMSPREMARQAQQRKQQAEVAIA